MARSSGYECAMFVYRSFPPAAAVLLLTLTGCTGQHKDTDDSASPDDTGTPDSTDTTDTTDSVDDTGYTPLFLDASVNLATEPYTNLLLPYDVTVDSTQRRAWVTSLYEDVVGLIDIDTERLLGVYTLPDDEYNLPIVMADGEGDAWMANRSGLVKITLDGDVTSYPIEFPIQNIFGGPGATVYVSSDDSSTTSGATLAIVDGDGLVVTSTTLDKDIMSIGAGPDGTIATSTMSSEGATGIAVWSSDTLELLDECASPFTASAIFPLSDGNFFVLRDTQVGYARCDGVEPSSVVLGEENKFAVVGTDTITVFDRIGDDTTGGRALGMARYLDLDLNVTGTFTTGKHSGFGGFDAATGQVWINSEGTSEVQAYVVDTGENTANVRTGTHVEGFTVSDQIGVAWVTGRLSGLIARVDLASGDTTPASEGPMWPVCPLWHDGVLYLLDQIEGVLYTYDPDTMRLVHQWPLGVAQNDDLDFDDMVWSSAHGTLLVAIGMANQLVEVNPLTGDVLDRYDLGGNAPPAGMTVGRVEIVTLGEEVWVVRSSDSMATHIRLDTREVSAAVLATTHQVTEAQYELVPKLAWLTSDGARLYFGSLAFDAQTFAALPEYDVRGTRIVGEPDGAYLTWAAATGDIDFGNPGDAMNTVSTVEVEGGDPYVRWLSEWGGGLMFIDSEVAAIRMKDLRL